MAIDLVVPDLADVEIGTVLAAMADPVRRSVVLELLDRTTNDGAEFACSSFTLPVAKSTRTHHWKVLREAGLINQRDLGNGSAVRLRSAFEDRFPGLLAAVRAGAADD